LADDLRASSQLSARERAVRTLGMCAVLALPRQEVGPDDFVAANAQAPGVAQEKSEERKWIDAEDGWFDLSRFIEQPHGFVPLFMPITEPALGYGVVATAVFLDPREEAGSEGWARPNITAVGGMWTENGSDGLFVGNSSLWDDGDLQTLVAGGTVNLELDLFGIGDDPVREDDPLGYRLEVDGIVGEGRRRMGESDFWLALRLVFARATVDFDGPPGGIPGVDPDDDDIRLAGPALGLRYDSFDNLFSPTRGLLSDTSLSLFDQAFGGTQDFQLFQQVLIKHWPLSESFFLGARLQENSSFGNTPFYARPFIQLRGVPALRYQGEHALSAELELRWQFHPRLSLIGFGGAGLAWTDFEQFEREQSAFTEGLGMRYLLARKFGLQAGLDVARGPEESAIYVQFGNAWLRP